MSVDEKSFAGIDSVPVNSTPLQADGDAWGNWSAIAADLPQNTAEDDDGQWMSADTRNALLGYAGQKPEDLSDPKPLPELPGKYSEETDTGYGEFAERMMFSSMSDADKLRFMKARGSTEKEIDAAARRMLDERNTADVESLKYPEGDIDAIAAGLGPYSAEYGRQYVETLAKDNPDTLRDLWTKARTSTAQYSNSLEYTMYRAGAIGTDSAVLAADFRRLAEDTYGGTTRAAFNLGKDFVFGGMRMATAGGKWAASTGLRFLSYLGPNEQMKRSRYPYGPLTPEQQGEFEGSVRQESPMQRAAAAVQESALESEAYWSRPEARTGSFLYDKIFSPVASGLGTVGTSIASFMINPALGWAVMYGSGKGEVYGKAKAEGLDDDTAHLVSDIGGLAMAALERLGAEKIMSSWRVASPAGQQAIRTIATPVVGEGVTEGLQSLTGSLAAEIGIGIEQGFEFAFDKDRVWKAVKEAGLETIYGSITGGVAGGAGYRPFHTAAKEFGHRNYQKLVDGGVERLRRAPDLKTNPGAMKRLTDDALTRAGAPDSGYIEATEFERYFQGDVKRMREAMVEMEVTQQQLDAAKEAGAQVEVSTSGLMRYVAANEQAEALKAWVRPDPEGPTLAIIAREAQVEGEIAAEVTAIREENKKMPSAFKEVREQLFDAGYDSEGVQHASEFLYALCRVAGKRLGLTPEQFLDLNPIKVTLTDSYKRLQQYRDIAERIRWESQPESAREAAQPEAQAAEATPEAATAEAISGIAAQPAIDEAAWVNEAAATILEQAALPQEQKDAFAGYVRSALESGEAFDATELAREYETSVMFAEGLEQAARGLDRILADPGAITQTVFDAAGIDAPTAQEGMAELQKRAADLRRRAEGYRNIQSSPALLEQVRNIAKPTKTRGDVVMTPDIDIVRLFSGRQDRSTFMHETYHIFNRRFVDAVKAKNAPPQLVADFNTINDAVGGGLDSADPDIRRTAEEKAAGMAEKYLSEGKAPSPALATAFSRFRTWLANIYRGVKEFADIELSDEVRGVFDRMLATGEDIAQADIYYHTLETLAPPTGSTPEQAAGMAERAERARLTTEERQHARVLSEFIGGAEGRKELRSQSRREVAERRQYQAADALRRMGGLSHEDVANEIGDAEAKRLQQNHRAIIRENPRAAKDNSARLEQLAKEYGWESYAKLMEDAVNMDVGVTLMDKIANLGGLDETYITRVYGRDAANKIRENFGDRIFRREGGITGAMLVAEDHGYASVANMLADISVAPDYRTAVAQTYQQKIAEMDAVVTQAMAQDAVTPVDEAYHNDALSRAMAAKQDVLDQQAREQADREGRRMHRQLSGLAMKRIAEELVGGRPGAKAGRYLTAVAAYRKHAEAAAKADAAGDKVTAAKEYQQMRLSHYEIKAAIQAKHDLERFERNQTHANKWVKRLEGKGKSIPPVIESFRNAIKDLLTSFKVVDSDRLKPDGERGQTVEVPGAVDPSVAALAPPLKEYIPEWILRREGADQLNSWRDLSMDRIRELSDALDILTDKGRGEMRALRLPGINTVNEMISNSKARMASRTPRPKQYGRGTESDGKGDRAGSWFDGFLMKGIVPEYLFAMMDGNTNITGQGIGPMQNIAIKFREGLGRKNTMFVQDLAAIKSARKTLRQFSKRFKNMDKSILGPVPEGLRQAYGFNLEWDGEMAAMVALNVGTVNNLNAITNGYGMSQAQIDQILSVFTNAELEAIQTIWDVVGSHFDETDAVHYRLYNRHIVKEQAVAKTITRADGTTFELHGGYFPLLYDGIVDSDIGGTMDYEVSLNRGAQNAVRGRPRVQQGHTIARVGAARPPLLKLDTIYTHLDKSAHFIHLAEAVNEANAVTSDRGWAEMARSRFGEKAYRRTRDYIKYVADPDGHNLGQNDAARKALNWLRGKATVAALGFRAKTALKQRLDTLPAILHMSLHSRTGASGFKYWLMGVRDIGFASNVGFMNERIKTIYEKSAFMRDADGNPSADIRDALRRARGDGWMFEVAGQEITKEGVLNLAYLVMSSQDRAARASCWAGAYKMALAGDGDFDVNALRAKGTSEADIDALAVKFADGVAATFSASTAADLTAWQADKGLMNLFTTFLTGTVRRSSRLYQYLDAYRQGQMSVGRFAQAFVMDAAIQAWIPVFLAMSIQQILGDDDDDEITAGGIAFDVFFDPLLSFIDGVPFFNAVPSMIRYGRGDVLVPSGISEYTRQFNKAVSIKKNITKDEWDKAAWKGATLFGYVGGVPFENIYKESRGLLEALGVVEPSKKKKRK